jgi:predicted O-methyltransferase YrrM
MKLKVDFNRDPNQGQMMPVERMAMYNAVLSEKPKRMLEIGTWKGGGSTYILACAAYEIGSTLYTIEADKGLYEAALKLYDERMNILIPHVKFNLGYSQDVIPELLKDGDFNFVLFDGKEDPEQTVAEYDLLNKHMGLGSVIACHDWKTSKMAKLKEVIANDNTWYPMVSITNTPTGFMMFRREL